jgi:hypothetical protein
LQQPGARHQGEQNFSQFHVDLLLFTYVDPNWPTRQMELIPIPKQKSFQ